MPIPSLITLALCTLPLVVTDIREHRLPNRWNLALALGGVTGQLIRSIHGHTLLPLRGAVLAGLVGLIVMVVLQLLSCGGLGMGDVKLVGALGLAVGDMLAVGAIVVLAFLTAAVWASVQLLIRRYHRGTRLAFGPFILLAAWVVVALP